jgi:membrane protein
MSIFKTIFDLLKETVAEWTRDNAAQLGAALAFYTALSLAPLLVLVVVMISLVFGTTSYTGEIVDGTRQMIGPDAANVIGSILENAGTSGSSILATVISIGMLMFGASAVFGQLKRALNTVWELRRKPDEGVTKVIKDRLASFLMVLVAGSLLIASLLFDTVLSALGGAIGNWLPAAPDVMQIFTLLQSIQAAKFLFSLLIFATLFAFIYKTVPDAEITWSDVWIGGLVTSLLFTGGNLLIGLYLGRSSVGSAYGAAGSLVALLVWVYYSAQVFFFGAEFTQVYANTYGSQILPDDDAVAVVRETRTRKETFDMMRPRWGGQSEAAGEAAAAQQAEAGDVEPAMDTTEADSSASTEDDHRKATIRKRGLLAAGGALVSSAVAGLLLGMWRHSRDADGGGEDVEE